MATLLVWRLGALGDTLLVLPALAALRGAFPTHTIVAAGNPTYLQPAAWSHVVDAVLDASSSTLAPLVDSRPPDPRTLPGDIDLAIVWSNGHAAIACGLERAGVRRVISAPALPSERMPVTSYYAEALAALGVKPVRFQLRPPLHARAGRVRAWRVAAGASSRVLVHPGAGSTLKRWPLAKYLCLAQSLRATGASVVWSVGPADDDLRTRLTDVGERDNILPLLDLAELTTIVDGADVVVSGDCGVAHLSALVGTPTVTLFGPTDHRVWAPPGARTRILSLELPCAPCAPLAPACPSYMCLRGLPVDAVRETVLHVCKSDVNDSDAPPVPTPPELCRPRDRVPAPPAPLQVGRWVRARSWAIQPSRGPE